MEVLDYVPGPKAPVGCLASDLISLGNDERSRRYFYSVLLRPLSLDPMEPLGVYSFVGSSVGWSVREFHVAYSIWTSSLAIIFGEMYNDLIFSIL